MNRKRIAAAAIAVAGIVIAYAATRESGRREDEPQRPALVLPDPTPQEKVEFFYRVFKSGARTTLGGVQISTWRDFGEGPLTELGRPALDYLFSADRFHEYKNAPNVLANVLRFLPQMPAAGGHPQLYPFLLHWLDPRNCPPRTPNSDWPSDLRKDVFSVFGAFPKAAAVPFCMDELRRERRVHDLRSTALATLIRTGNGKKILDLYDSLPPNAKEETPNLRTEMVLSLYRLAAPKASERSHAAVDELEPILRKALASPRAVERFNAMGTLYRRGEEEMADRLIDVYEQTKDSEPNTAWSALMLLAADRPHPFVREVSIEELAHPARDTGFQAAARLVARWWPESEPGRTRLWDAVERRDIHPLGVLPALAATDRERVIVYLRRELSNESTQRVEEAVRLIVGRRLTELGPDLMALVREVPRRQRPYFYRALAILRTAGVEALLLAELADRADRIIRGAAATELLNMGGERGVTRVREELEDGDPEILQVLLTRVRNRGRTGIPDALLPAVIGILRTAPGEDARRTALFVLRYRATLEGVRSGLLEADRREPSRRLAGDIRTVLLELAHR